jgi:hypothetical protein
LAEQAERYDEMVDFMKEVAKVSVLHRPDCLGRALTSSPAA